MFHFHPKHHSTPATVKLSFTRIFFSIALAGIDTIWAIYMHSLGMTDAQVGFFSAILVFLSLIACLGSTPAMQKLNSYRVFILSIIMLALTYIALFVYRNLFFFLGLAIVATIGFITQWNSFQLVFRDNSSKKNIARDESILFTFINIGWLLGPLIAGYVIIRFNSAAVFVSSALFLLIGLLIFATIKIKHSHKLDGHVDTNVFENIKSYWKQKKLRLAYFIGGSVEIWWALIYVYLPLYIVNNLGNEEYVGWFLALVIIPLVLFEFLAGKLARLYGYRQFFVWGFIALGVAAVVAFFFANPYVVLFIIILSSIPMAFIEPLHDPYFLELIKQKEEEKLYPLFVTSDYVGSIFGRVLAAIVLLFFPFKAIFIVFGVLMFFTAFVATKMHSVVKKKKLM